MSNKKDAQIAFLSGTIHPVSAENFCDFLNKRYGRKLAVVSTERGDTEAGNKTELHVIPDDALKSEKEQVNRVVNWVQRGEKGNAIILFSKRKINNLVQEAIKRLSQKDIRYDFNTPTNDRAKKEKIDRYRRALAYSNPNASAEEIKQMVDEFTKKEFPSSQQDEIEKIKNKPGAMMIENKSLRTAVSYGIGYIYTKDDVEPGDQRADYYTDTQAISENDKLIVANLFSEGKINVLIATAAIGIGVNVSIKNMYIPSCMKFERNKHNEGRMDLNNKREMSQLINRTGRGKTPISGIYTPSEFVPFLQSVVMSGAENFNVVPAISIRHSDNLQTVLLNLMDAVPGTVKVVKGTFDISKKIGRFIGGLPVIKHIVSSTSYRTKTADDLRREAEERRRLEQEMAAKFADINLEFNQIYNQYRNVWKPALDDKERNLIDALTDLNRIKRDPNSTPADIASALEDYIDFQHEYDQYKFNLTHMMTDRYLKIKEELHKHPAYNTIPIFRHAPAEMNNILNLIKTFNKDNKIKVIDSRIELNKTIMDQIKKLKAEINNISGLLNNQNISAEDRQKLTTQIDIIKYDITILTGKIKR